MQEQELSFQHTQVQKKRWWSRFFSLSFGSSLPEDLKLRDVSHVKVNQELDKQINMLLQAGLYDAYFQACERGYQPKAHQEQQINQVIVDLVQRGEFIQIEHYLEQGLQLNEQLVYQIITDKAFQDQITPRDYGFFKQQEKNFQILALPLFSERLREILFSSSFRDFLTKKWFDSFERMVALAKAANSNDEIKDFTDTKQHEFTRLMLRHVFLPMEMHAHLYQVQPSQFEQYLKLMEQWNLSSRGAIKILSYARQKRELSQTKRFETFKEVAQSIEEKTAFLKQLSETFFKKNVNELLDQTQALNLDKRLQKAVQNTGKNLYQEMSFSQLPEAATEIIERIHQQYEKLAQSGVNDIELERLVTQQVPKVLTKFLRIDDEYRQSLKNEQGYTPEQIMLQTLHNIAQKFEEKMLTEQEGHFHDLNALKRYSQKI